MISTDIWDICWPSPRRFLCLHCLHSGSFSSGGCELGPVLDVGIPSLLRPSSIIHLAGVADTADLFAQNNRKLTISITKTKGRRRVAHRRRGCPVLALLGRESRTSCSSQTATTSSRDPTCHALRIAPVPTSPTDAFRHLQLLSATAEAGNGSGPIGLRALVGTGAPGLRFLRGRFWGTWPNADREVNFLPCLFFREKAHNRNRGCSAQAETLSEFQGSLLARLCNCETLPAVWEP